MMNCDKAKLLLSEYLDNTLEPGVKKEIDDFLRGNEECSKIFAEAMSVQNQLKSLPKVKPSEEFEVNLRNRVIEFNESGTTQTTLNKKGLSFAFSGAVLVAVLYMFILTDEGSQQNISDEILPSSTITNTKSSANVATDSWMVKQEKEEEKAAESDSTKNLPEKVDNSGIHLTGDGR